jgi:hypothetical protein
VKETIAIDMQAPSNQNQSCIFMPLAKFQGLTEAKTTELANDFDISIEGIERSYVKDVYWTTTWTETQPFDREDSDSPHPDDKYAVLRNKNSAVSKYPDADELMERILESPLYRVRFYDGTNPLSLEGRVSVIEKSRKRTPGRKSTSQKVAYEFPELLGIQDEYIHRLFRNLWQSVYDEQEQGVRGSPRSQANGSLNLMPPNNLINKFVTEMTLETLDGHHYCIFTYEELSGSAGDSEEDDIENDLPEKIDLTAVVPLDEEDEVDSEDGEYIGVDEDGNEGVLYDIYLTRVKFDIKSDSNQP